MKRGKRFRMTEPAMTKPLPKTLRVFNYRLCGGVSRAAKGADCKSAGLRLRRFESYLPHQIVIRDQVSGTSGINNRLIPDC
jgi:hypothetical protein